MNNEENRLTYVVPYHLLTDEELKRLLTVASKDKNQVYYEILSDLVITGKRLSEVTKGYKNVNPFDFDTWLNLIAWKIFDKPLFAYDFRKINAERYRQLGVSEASINKHLGPLPPLTHEEFIKIKQNISHIPANYHDVMQKKRRQRKISLEPDPKLSGSEDKEKSVSTKS